MATMTIQSRGTFQTQDNRFSRNSNMAGSPLPLIPRRPIRSRSAPMASTPAQTIPVLTVQWPAANTQPFPTAADDTDSSSSSNPSDGTRPTIRTKRERGIRTPAQTPSESSSLTTTSSSREKEEFSSVACVSQSPPRASKSDENTPPSSPPRPLMYSPGMLRLSIDSIKARNASSSVQAYAESSAQGMKSAPLPSEDNRPPVIRKKSGQLVKPSLKMSNSTRGGLTVVTFGSASKSEPATPTASKAVHFDSKLEHVKLFLAEQKPTAVSRDGSPTDDTSGTESDFPSFIYGDKNDKRSKMKLVMRINNMPPAVNPDADVALEDISLSADGLNIQGRVRVRNLAYAKWVTVRFTFDSWHTTSDVTGKYLDSLGSNFDRFTFTIKLNDLLARIEEKTLFLAVRYSIEGREMWDSNNGANYHASFSWVKPAGKACPHSEDEGSDASDAADLRNKLEKVVQGEQRTGPAFLAQNTRRNAGLADREPPAFRTNTSFASRYDFGASLKSPWKPVEVSPRHTRAVSYPALTQSSVPQSHVPWPPQKNAKVLPVANLKTLPILGSPRDIDAEHYFASPRVASDLDDAPFPVPTRDRAVRNHQRGYFDLNIVSSPATIRRTPPGSPGKKFDDFSPARCYSFPPIEHVRAPAPSSPAARNTPEVVPLEVDLSEDSTLSTPSLGTPSSSTSVSPTDNFMSDMITHAGAAMPPLSPSADYRHFLNRFCFFTGADTPDSLPRTQSASDVEEFLSGIAPRDLLDIPTTPTRSPSFDELLTTNSGSSTPTNHTPKAMLRVFSLPPRTA